MAPARPGVASGTKRTTSIAQARGVWVRLLLVSGIVSSALYTAMLVVVPLSWPGYSSVSRVVSELSAIGAPSRPLWVSLGFVWTLSYVAFGLGVWLSGAGGRALRVVGSMIVASGVVGAFWPPMHQRDVLAAGGQR